MKFASEITFFFCPFPKGFFPSDLSKRDILVCSAISCVSVQLHWAISSRKNTSFLMFRNIVVLFSLTVAVSHRTDNRLAYFAFLIICVGP